MGLLQSLEDDRVKKLRSLSYKEMGGESPYVTRDLPKGLGEQGHSTNEVSARADDLVRMTKMFMDAPGLKFSASQGILQSASKLIKPGQTVGNFLRTAVSSLGGVAKAVGYTLRQVPVSGTGTHFISIFNTPTYLGLGGDEGAPYAKNGTYIVPDNFYKDPSWTPQHTSDLLARLQGSITSLVIGGDNLRAPHKEGEGYIPVEGYIRAKEGQDIVLDNNPGDEWEPLAASELQEKRTKDPSDLGKSVDRTASPDIAFNSKVKPQRWTPAEGKKYLTSTITDEGTGGGEDRRSDSLLNQSSSPNGLGSDHYKEPLRVESPRASYSQYNIDQVNRWAPKSPEGDDTYINYLKDTNIAVRLKPNKNDKPDDKGSYGPDPMGLLKESTQSILGKEGQDYNIIPFEIKSISGDTEYYLYFRAFLDKLDDNYSGEWAGTRYVGRAEEFYTYQGFSRSIDFAFKVAAFSKEEIQPLYRKLNYLASITAPTYDRTDIFMKGVMSRVTIGDYISRLSGVITKVGFSWDTSTPWEIGYDESTSDAPMKLNEKLLRVPHILSVNVSFLPIHNFNVKHDFDIRSAAYIGIPSKFA